MGGCQRGKSCGCQLCTTARHIDVDAKYIRNAHDGAQREQHQQSFPHGEVVCSRVQSCAVSCPYICAKRKDAPIGKKRRKTSTIQSLLAIPRVIDRCNKVALVWCGASDVLLAWCRGRDSPPQLSRRLEPRLACDGSCRGGSGSQG